MKRISYAIKSSKMLYFIYFNVMSFVLRILGLFVRIDKRIILINSFGGKKYDDSPRAIYEAMLEDERFDDYILIWSFHDPEGVKIPGRAKVIKTDSIQYFTTALKARVWITNSSIERGLSFKKKGTLCFNTWHGTPIKVMGVDIESSNKSFQSKINVRADMMLAQGQYDVDIFSHAFELEPTRFRLVGLPRNDVLANYSEDDVVRIRERLGISPDKKIFLYAPTYREYTKGQHQEVELRVPIDPQHWQDVLGQDYIILFRAHYEVAAYLNLSNYDQFLDVSQYPSLNDLIIASDALISDYSSIYFDYAITHKPMYCFAYDQEQYMKNRGTYLDLNEELPCVIHHDEDGLLEELLNYSIDFEDKKKKTIEFCKKYVTTYGNASSLSCDIIINEIGV